MASITVNISWNGLASHVNIEKYQIWVGSKALEEYEEPTSDGAMTRFEVNSYTSYRNFFSREVFACVVEIAFIFI